MSLRFPSNLTQKKKVPNSILNFLLNFTEDLKAKHAVLITNY